MTQTHILTAMTLIEEGRSGVGGVSECRYDTVGGSEGCRSVSEGCRYDTVGVSEPGLRAAPRTILVNFN